MATRPQTTFGTGDLTHRLPAICFKFAALAALGGVSLGIYMGIGQDHSLAPVHVHLNLIGWVSLFLFGLFYKLHAEAADGLAALQVGLSVIGCITMLSGLAGLLLTAQPLFLFVAIVGSLLVWAGFALFCLIVARAA